MGTWMEIAVTLACLSVVAFVGFAIPLLITLRKQIESAAADAKEIKEDLHLLIRDTRQMVQTIDEMSRRANRQLDETGEIIHTVQGWTQRADGVVRQTSTLLEIPLTALTGKLNILRIGMSAFLAVLNRNRAN